ncbi:MAG: DNA-protecting protein DprA [Ignavibacteriales bacterium]|nr:DNA-protecting protein DprA [Ignavibacteriales bacterium]
MLGSPECARPPGTDDLARPLGRAVRTSGVGPAAPRRGSGTHRATRRPGPVLLAGAGVTAGYPARSPRSTTRPRCCSTAARRPTRRGRSSAWWARACPRARAATRLAGSVSSWPASRSASSRARPGRGPRGARGLLARGRLFPRGARVRPRPGRARPRAAAPPGACSRPGGMLLSEYPPGTPPRTWHFPSATASSAACAARWSWSRRPGSGARSTPLTSPWSRAGTSARARGRARGAVGFRCSRLFGNT